MLYFIIVIKTQNSETQLISCKTDLSAVSMWEKIDLLKHKLTLITIEKLLIIG